VAVLPPTVSSPPDSASSQRASISSPESVGIRALIVLEPLGELLGAGRDVKKGRLDLVVDPISVQIISLVFVHGYLVACGWSRRDIPYRYRQPANVDEAALS
jgi:hypothetical protein